MKSNNLDQLIIQGAALIKQGGVVAFPTETYYGLAVDPFNEEALERLFQLKRRPLDKPILTLVEDVDQLYLLARYIPSCYHSLIEHFWPGALTLLFPAHGRLSSLLTGKSRDIGARISSHPVASELVRACGFPITATSANISGSPAARRAQEVRDQLGDIDLLIANDDFSCGQGSTIVSCRNDHPHIVRSGAVSSWRIMEILCKNI